MRGRDSSFTTEELPELMKELDEMTKCFFGDVQLQRHFRRFGVPVKRH